MTVRLPRRSWHVDVTVAATGERRERLCKRFYTEKGARRWAHTVTGTDVQNALACRAAQNLCALPVTAVPVFAVGVRLQPT